MPENQRLAHYGDISTTMSGKGLLESGATKQFRLCLLFAAIMSILLAGCYPITRSKGVVKDEQGQPVAHATVKISGTSAKPEELQTQPDGTFDFGTVEVISHQDPIEIKLTVEKEGFDRFSKPLIFNASNTDEIILHRSAR